MCHFSMALFRGHHIICYNHSQDEYNQTAGRVTGMAEARTVGNVYREE